MANDVTLSREGYERLKAELEELKSVERARIADNIREAKSHGDLRENAMYHEAKLNQKRLEGRIADLEHVLQVAKVVDTGEHDSDVAHMGSKVTVKDLEWGDEIQFTLVGAFEADPANDLISVSSPLGEALVGHPVGAEVQFETPAGPQKYKILAIEPASAG
ncbi:MAG: transcription elongation factor GreA [Fimbriimonadaceae bacterium]|nr:transcription elongation factor GreA [Fimbriimonadaceae bacterium]QYK54908.1 MAG: transcription elongation factor GreA [Fimbriimonadaceae bacterium]